MDPARLTGYARERIGVRIRILRLLPAAGPRLLALAIALQLVAGLVPVGFIVATSAVVGRVPDAVEGGLDSPAWDSLRNALLVASVLFLLLHVSLAVQWTVSRAIEWAVDETVRERVVAASFAPAGVAALEDEQTLDELGDIVDPLRSIGFSPAAPAPGCFPCSPATCSRGSHRHSSGSSIRGGRVSPRRSGRSRFASESAPASAASLPSRRRMLPCGAAATTTPVSSTAPARRRRSGSSACSRGSRSGTGRRRWTPCDPCGARVAGSSTSPTWRRCRSRSCSPASLRSASRVRPRSATSRSARWRSRCRRSCSRGC